MTNKGLNLQEDFFRYNGTLYTAVNSESPIKCTRCAFLPFGSPLCARAPLCTAAFRLDRRNVIWLLVNNKDNHWARGKITELKQLVSKEIQDD